MGNSVNIAPLMTDSPLFEFTHSAKTLLFRGVALFGGAVTLSGSTNEHG